MASTATRLSRPFQRASRTQELVDTSKASGSAFGGLLSVRAPLMRDSGSDDNNETTGVETIMEDDTKRNGKV